VVLDEKDKSRLWTLLCRVLIAEVEVGVGAVVGAAAVATAAAPAAAAVALLVMRVGGAA